jgi:hypothetical protein
MIAKRDLLVRVTPGANWIETAAQVTDERVVPVRGPGRSVDWLPSLAGADRENRARALVIRIGRSPG